MLFKEPNQTRSAETLREGYVSFGHSTVTLKLASGESVEIDKGVLDLITLMNSIPGIVTRGSCQGEDPNYGYVQFAPDETEGKAHASIYLLYHMMRNMHAAWVKHQHAMWQHEQSTGSEHPDAYRFKFTTELGNGYVMKWSPYTYPAVLAAAREAAQELRQSL
ncbi:hypothetical protein [Edaphobacter sp. 12200R-103]|jgi:hypothetical protein|uniref:hypothetical protein n=1 Tax=Edaphobacter sp. 12200R-103 TaxID=2703788 RepID=UPI00138C067C|nr:hypothetical protein [Edaphobacter sp. 12200R-103]QHS53413.1 hypothetical protein GWR55_18135 [Edaphobacter sp. 12200R-103]